MTDYTYDSGTPWEARKSSIAEVIIENGITSVGSYTFSNCINMKAVTFPSTLKTIGSRAFEYAEISQVSFPNGLERIEDGAFIYTSLTSVTIPDSVTYLGNHAFADISELKTVTLSTSITEIPFGLFVFDRSLESVHIPDGVATIRQNAFSFCNVLSSIELPDTITLIETSSFNGSEELKEVHYAGTQEQADAISIGTNNGPLSAATWFCKPDISKMNVLKLPADLTRIEPNAFEGVSCEAVIIPEKCTSIGSKAFANCHNLIYIVIPSSTDVANDVFDGCPENLRIDRE